MKRSFQGLCLVLFCMAACLPQAHAHKVTIFAWVEGDTVYTQSKFSAGKMVKDGKVEVFDSQGTRLLDGRTNDKGEFSFKVPEITDLKVVLTAGMGHQNVWKLSAAELGEVTTDAAATERVPPASLISEAPMVEKPSGVTTQAIEAIVARQLDQKLQPLFLMLADVQDRGPTASDIFGGIGYIIGLVGLGAYVRHRRDGRRS